MEGKETKEDAKDALRKTDKNIVYTHGLGYRSPTIHRVPVSLEKACEIIDDESLVDVKEFEDYIEVNTYSGNDMW